LFVRASRARLWVLVQDGDLGGRRARQAGDLVASRSLYLNVGIRL